MLTSLPLALLCRNLYPDCCWCCHDVCGLPGMLRRNPGVTVPSGDGKARCFGFCPAMWHQVVPVPLLPYPTSPAVSHFNLGLEAVVEIPDLNVFCLLGGLGNSEGLPQYLSEIVKVNPGKPSAAELQVSLMSGSSSDSWHSVSSFAQSAATPKTCASGEGHAGTCSKFSHAIQLQTRCQAS